MIAFAFVGPFYLSVFNHSLKSTIILSEIQVNNKRNKKDDYLVFNFPIASPPRYPLRPVNMNNTSSFRFTAAAART